MLHPLFIHCLSIIGPFFLAMKDTTDLPQPSPSMLRSLSKLPVARRPAARHVAVLRHDWTRAEAAGVGWGEPP